MIRNDEDWAWLDAAARMAAPFLGTTAENPTVGAIIRDPLAGKVRGVGVTAPGGRPHAETIALEKAGKAAERTTLYVTLEPCHHTGRTPPCVDAVIEAGIARVVIGQIDPDPRTAGQSVSRLKAAGVEVAVVKDHDASRRLHEGHIARQTLGRPFVSAKLAVSRDGMIGLPDRGNVPVTGEAARRWTHMQRALSDAVMVGAGTARLDNPSLTVRIPGLGTRKPLRIILGGDLPVSLGLLTSTAQTPTWVLGESTRPQDLPKAVEWIPVGARDGRLDLDQALAELGEKGISRLLVEGGATLNASLLEAGLVDRFCLLKGAGMIGEAGVPAMPGRSLEVALAAAGLEKVFSRPLGGDTLTVFERKR
ncbi:bifunctional diaminohydroxyphosphoribosylaminopyrimidine deaminase/5-amino-6-(5-phosphoribosylamino)uracil reductase RibD [Cucumibacter marinus]|uniref:bifunctional diaminohydroxyphosphoribosylaminopyrimidine deaminase/5-amino-6-(5-phosphoribosylamino)uracil reductase RibD n=1 Tax=Cucumibacter marinus TaxID=1121252 RepID=UPI0004227802|nr:bifunctional diaminohydroxyphosphoribosylaminopyrimidine deaminase/5-amino-6-(5-phosphoribosylamino)uracil reductase RibD [Cucumibacter marinus]